MIQRNDSGGKKIDIVLFNQQTSSGKNPSNDPLSQKLEVKQIKIFGLQQQTIDTYQFHEYQTTYILIPTIPDHIIKEFIMGYYGIDEDSIEKYKRDQDQIQFQIKTKYNIIQPIERQNRLGTYKTFSQTIFSYVPFIKAIDIKLKQITMIFKNILNEQDYINIFDQIPIGPLPPITLKKIIKNDIPQQIISFEKTDNQAQDIYISCVKYNNNYKGRYYFPMKFYYEFPQVEDNSLSIQTIQRDMITTYIFKQEKLIIQRQLVVDDPEIVPNIFGLYLSNLTKNIKTFQTQLDYKNQTQKQITKKIYNLKFMSIKKTHGNQFIIRGLKYQTDMIPEIKLTFFPKTTYAQIQCETDDLYAAVFNFNILMNYFQLEDPHPEYYEIDDKTKLPVVKKQFIEKYNQKFDWENKKQKPNLEGLGTDKFDVNQNIFHNQDAQLEDLQLIDPINYGTDDRYDYQKLVNDIQKRPIQIPYLSNGNDTEPKIEKPKKIVVKKSSGKYKKQKMLNASETRIELEGAQMRLEGAQMRLEGAGKGSPVYVNIEHDYKDFLKLQQNMILDGFVIRNQTFRQISNRFICSSKFPYLLLGNTKGKDVVSCALDPINPQGLSIFEFYDVAQRVLQNPTYIQYLRQFLYGRVSNSATRFTTWITPGRCAETPVNLKRLFSQQTVLLSVLMKDMKAQSDAQYLLDPEMDMEWFESVFGDKYENIFDSDVIYDYQDEQYYTTNINGKQCSLWIKFPNHKKYLLVYDDIKVEKNESSQKGHFYIPYYFTHKLFQKEQQFSIAYYKKKGMDIQGYMKLGFDENNYIVCKQGVFPMHDTTINLKLIDNINIEDKLPTYQQVIKLINDCDNFIINYKGNIIGTKYGEFTFYWKETKIETNQKLVIGTYPINVDNTKIYNYRYVFKENTLQTIAFNIYQFVRQSKYLLGEDIMKGLKDLNEIQLMTKILKDDKKVLEIFDFYHKLEKSQVVVTYNFKFVPILCQLDDKAIIDGLEILRKQLPDTDEMVYDYVKGIQDFHKGKQLYFWDDNKEEIFQHSYKKEYDIY